MTLAQLENQWMRQCLELATRGEGFVEPNPMVGSLVIAEGRIVGEGFHRAFGKPHAEVEALQKAGKRARGGTLFVTLEPCCHHGKTPPCTQAVINAGIARVVVAAGDPFDAVAGKGIQELRAAGIDVQTGVLEQEALALTAPYRKRIQTGRPWVIAKWAMTLDGKIATADGQSKWISSPAAREIVHRIRGRVDAIVVGRGTVLADDPLLTARPPGPRTATRIVLDSNASLALESQLVKTAHEAPVLVATDASAPEDATRRLTDAGCEVVRCLGDDSDERLVWLLEELGRRQMTNVLVEGGADVLGSFLALKQIDEVHTFVAPKLLGGQGPSAIAGLGHASMAEAPTLIDPIIESIGGDCYVHGRLRS